MFQREQFAEGETLFGTFYPKHYIVAVIPEQDQAQQAVAALREAGHPEQEARLWTGAEVLDRYNTFLQKRNVLERLGSYLPSDEHEALQQYVSEAEEGQYFVTVYAPHPDQIERARDILAKHGASDMHYYGEFVMTDLLTTG